MQLRLNRDLVFLWRNSNFVCDNFVDHQQKSLKPELFPLVHWFAEWRSLDSLGQLAERLKIPLETTQHLVRQLQQANILIEEGTEPSNTAWDDWGTATKYFHYNSRKVSADQFVDVVSDSALLAEKATEMAPPSLYKTYATKTIELSRPLEHKGSPFLTTLINRQTIRTYDPEKGISEAELSTLLFYVFGELSCLTDQGMGRAIYRTSPSGGARHSIEAYLCVFNVEGVEQGLYHYSVKYHALELLKLGDFRSLMVEFSGKQPHVGLPAVTLIYTSLLERIHWKYSDPRAYRTIYAELGHFSQTLYLVAGWLGLGAFFLAQFCDEKVETFLGLDSQVEISIGISGFGALTNEVKQFGRFVRHDVAY